MLSSQYQAIKAAYLDEIGFRVPERYHSSFVHWGGGAEAQYIYREFARSLAPAGKVLIVGVMGGRDYFLFANLGFEVTAVDLGPQPDIEPITFANIEDALPFDDESFDGVLIGEVLEHLRDDVRALENIRRVLKPDGKLMVSLPFFNDWEEGHMRIHSPESGRRLIKMGGFEVLDFLERPAILAPNFLNLFQHGVSFVAHRLTGRTAYPALIRFIGGLSWRLGHARWPRAVRRLSRHYGGYYLAGKAEAMDHVSVNRDLYTQSRKP